MEYLRYRIAAFMFTLSAIQSNAQDRPQDYWHYVGERRMLYSCDNLDWEFTPELNRSSSACLAFSCDYKSPTMTILIRHYKRPVLIETEDSQRRVTASKTLEEGDFAAFFKMDAKVVVLDGNQALRDEVAKDWTITMPKRSYQFVSPKSSEDAEVAFARFSDDCL